MNTFIYQLKFKFIERLESFKYYLFESCFKLANKLADTLNLTDETVVFMIEHYFKNRVLLGRKLVEMPTTPRLGNISLAEALYSNDSTLHHDIANKLIVEYSMNLGEVDQRELFRCAEIMLEGFSYTNDHVTRLIKAWSKQRAGEIEVNGTFSNEEAVIFDELNKK